MFSSETQKANAERRRVRCLRPQGHPKVHRPPVLQRFLRTVGRWVSWPELKTHQRLQYYGDVRHRPFISPRVVLHPSQR